MTGPSPTIQCAECGGTAHLISFMPDDGPLEEGYPIAYQCSDCTERFDLVWEGDED